MPLGCSHGIIFLVAKTIRERRRIVDAIFTIGLFYILYSLVVADESIVKDIKYIKAEN